MKKRNVDTETDTQREDEVKTHKGKTVLWLEWCIYKLRNAKGCWQIPEARSKERVSSQTARESLVLPMPWLWTSGLQNCETIHLCCSKPPSFWYLVTALGNKSRIQAELCAAQRKNGALVPVCTYMCVLGRCCWCCKVITSWAGSGPAPGKLSWCHLPEMT